MSTERTSPKLTHKQQLFIEHYVQCWNATEAARLAGYKQPRQMGSENLSKPVISEAIEERIKVVKKTTDDVLGRLTEQAWASLGDFIEFYKHNITGADIPRLDLKKAQEMGRLHLVKKLKIDEGKGKIEFELYDAQNALIQLAKMMGMYKQDELTLKLPPEVAAAIGGLGVSMDTFMKEVAALLLEERGAS